MALGSRGWKRSWVGKGERRAEQASWTKGGGDGQRKGMRENLQRVFTMGENG